MNDENLRSDRRATLFGTLISLGGFLVVGIAMFAPVAEETKLAAIVASGGIGSTSSIGVANSNKVITSSNDEKGQF